MKNIRFLKHARWIALILLASTHLTPMRAGVLNADTQVVNLNFSHASLLNVIWELQKQTDFLFIYSTSDVENVKVNNLNVKDKSLTAVLDECVKNTDLEYTVNKEVISIRKAESKTGPAVANQQNQADATGTVKDTDGSPMIGVSITYGTKGDITDANGVFTLKNVPIGTTLKFSMIGYEPVEMEFKGKPLNIIMESVSFSMDEVLVVAYGEQKRAAFTGSASVVNSESIAKRPVTNVMASLEGMSTGVQVSSESGSPSSTPSFRIRGVSSISAGKDPLIVLDGMPYGGSWNHINPNDVDNISVLKDASSTALYGARGANGVILITTKKAKKGEPVVTFDSKFGLTTRRADRYDVIKNPAEHYEVHYKSLYNYYADKNGWDSYRSHQEANRTLGLNDGEGGLGYVVFTAPENEYLIGTNGKMNPNATLGRMVTNPVTGETYWITPDNWRNEAYKTGIRQDYTLTVSGGSDKLQLVTSLAYTKESGIVDAADYERITGRVNFGYQIKRWLRLTSNISLARSNSDGASSSVFSTIDHMAPIYPIYLRDANKNIMYDSNGKMYDYGDGAVNGLDRPYTRGHSYFQTNKLNTSNTRSLGVTAQTGLDISFTEDLKAKIAVNFGNRENRGTSTTQPFYGRDVVNKGVVSKTHTRNETIHMLQQLNYSKLINKHNIQLLAAHEYFKQRYYYLGGSRTNMYSYFENQELAGAIIETGNSSYTTDYRTEGYLFRALYDYDNRYFVSAHYRRDATTNFHPDHKWGNFFSFGGAWMASQESWFNVPHVDVLKVKVAYGENGNDAIGSSRYEDNYTINNVDGDIALLFNRKGKETITWETKASTNVGIEFEMFKSRLRGSIEYYNSKTTDMLASISVPLSSGYSSYFDNIGDMRNSGIEFELHGDLIRNKAFRWSMYINGSHNKNKVLKLADERKTIELYDFDKKKNISKGYYDGSYFIGEGLSYYTFRLRKWAGVNENGEATWYITDEETNETTTTTDHSTATYYLSGEASPKLQGGFGSSFEWKGIDLSFAFSYRIGGVAYDGQYASLMGVPQTSSTGSAFHKDVLNAWTKENPNNDIPRWQFDDKYFSSSSDRFLLNASYLKLQNINLGYTFDRNLTSKLGISNLRLSVMADNLFYLSKRKGFNPSRSFNGNLGSGSFTEVTKVIFNLGFKF